MNWKVLTQNPDAQLTQKWNEFLENASFPTHYTTPDFFVDPFVRGGEKFAVLAFDENEKISAVLTGIENGKTIISGLPVRPQTAFRKDADRFRAATALTAGLKQKGGAKSELIDFYTWEQVKEFEELGFQANQCGEDESIILLDLSKSAEQLFKEFSQTRRSELRKVMKQNQLEIKDLETDEELRQLYEIHTDWNSRKGNQPDTFEQLKFAAAQIDYRKILIAKYEEKVIAGSFYRFCKGGMVEYAGNNSLTEFQKLRPNDLIGWRSIEWACREKFTHYSMGGSHLFLRRFGGELVSPYRYKLDRSFLRIHNLRENILNIGIKTYRSLPVSVKTKIKQIAGKT